MKFKIFSIYDSKAESFNTPMFLPAEGQAIRTFEDAVNEKGSPMNTHPEDYTLFLLGEFDTDLGSVEAEPTPKSLGLAQGYIRQDLLIEPTPSRSIMGN